MSSAIMGQVTSRPLKFTIIQDIPRKENSQGTYYFSLPIHLQFSIQMSSPVDLSILLVWEKILNIPLQIHDQLFLQDGTSQTFGFQTRTEADSRSTPDKIALVKANLLTNHHKAPHKNKSPNKDWLNTHLTQSL